MSPVFLHVPARLEANDQYFNISAEPESSAEAELSLLSTWFTLYFH